MKALVVCSDPDARQSLSRAADHCRVLPLHSSSVRDALAILNRERIDVVLCEDYLEDGNFRDILGAVSRRPAKVPIIVASRLDDWGQYLEAMSAGAFEYVLLPSRQAEVGPDVHIALRESLRLSILSRPERSRHLALVGGGLNER
jgi:DNA-binding NtrC family response regulator